MTLILLVEHDSESRSRNKAALEDIGFATKTVSSAADALAYLSELESSEMPSCILSDLQMPRMLGVDLAKMVQEKYGIPIVLMSDDLTDLNSDRIYRSGVSSVIQKPFRITKFVEFLKGNDIDISAERLRSRKYLRNNTDLDELEVSVSNGKQTSTGKILNISMRGMRVELTTVLQPLSTVSFTLRLRNEEISGFMHCRWKSSPSATITVGFEFDSLTQSKISKNQAFFKWLNADLND